MAFRTTFSRFDNSADTRAVSSLEIVLAINGVRVARCQGVTHNGRTNNRPVQELGTDRVVEFVPGIKNFSGTIRSITIQYGDITQRLASAAGTPIDAMSRAAMLSNFPDFSIEVYKRGSVDFSNSSPTAFATPDSSQDLAGRGALMQQFVGCSLTNYDQQYNVNDALIMESVSFEFVDLAIAAQQTAQQNALLTN